MKHKIYVGTYADENEASILKYAVDENTGALKLELTLSGVSNPSYLALSKDGSMLYAVIENMEFQGESGGGICAIACSENSMKIINSKNTTGTSPCHVTLDEKSGAIYVANYSNGSLAAFKLMPDNSLGEMSDYIKHEGKGDSPTRQEGPHMHFSCVSSNNEGIWCVDLGLDKIFFYEINRQDMTLCHNPKRDIMFPKGTGPRHFVVASNNVNIMYVACELSSEVIVVALSKGSNQILQRISTLSEPDENNTCAAIKCSDDNRFIYVSNRGDDSIAQFEINEFTGLLKLVLIEKVGGKSPRDILVLDDMLLCANQESNTITCFSRDRTSGKLLRLPEESNCRFPVCIVNAPCV